MVVYFIYTKKNLGQPGLEDATHISPLGPYTCRGMSIAQIPCAVHKFITNNWNSVNTYTIFFPQHTVPDFLFNTPFLSTKYPQVDLHGTDLSVRKCLC